MLTAMAAGGDALTPTTPATATATTTTTTTINNNIIDARAATFLCCQ